MNKYLQVAKTTLEKGTHFVKGNSPSILLGVGVLGAIGTVVFTVKATKNISEELDIADLEEENGNPVDKKDLGIKIAKHAAPAVVCGVITMASIFYSHRILVRRLAATASALTAVTTEYMEYRNEVKEEYGEEKDKEIYKKAVVKAREKMDVKGVDVGRSIYGFDFTLSPEYTSDDHEYNMSFIKSCEEHLENERFRRGFLTINEVYDMFGIERSRQGSYLGWTVGGSFELTPIVTNVENEDGEFIPNIFVAWKPPKDIYNVLKYSYR